MQAKVVFFAGFFLCGTLHAQSLSGVVNRYAQVVSVFASNAADVDSLEVLPASVSLFSAGDTVMIYQAGVRSFSYLNNQITVSASGYAGRFEITRISKITGNILVLSSPLSHEGSVTYHPEGKVQVVRIPSYYDATVPVNEVLTALPWDGNKGGIVALMVRHCFTLEGKIDVSGKGFRGAQPTASSFSLPAICVSSDSSKFATRYGDYTLLSDYAGLKGEGIIVLPDSMKRGLGNAINGGGGGSGYLSGGAGGSGVGDGGVGGNEASICYHTGYLINAERGKGLSSVFPDIAEKRRVFMGGGGGAGVYLSSQPSFLSSAGGNGGGLVIIMAGKIDGHGEIIGNGSAPAMVAGGGGGGGGAGSIVVEANDYAGTIKISAKGGEGGNSSGCPAGSGMGAGGGGGGGGGLVGLNAGALPSGMTLNTAGGSFGRNFSSCSNNTAHSGNEGGVLYNLLIPLQGFCFNFLPDSQVICAGDHADTIRGSVPKGAGVPSYTWEWSTDGMTWNTLASNTRDYCPSWAFVQTTFFRRIVNLGIFSDTSNIHVIKVYPAVAGNILQATPSKVCEDDGGSIGIKTALSLSGGVPYAAWNYEWENDFSGSWQKMTEQTENVTLLNPGKTTRYRRRASRGISNGTCSHLSTPLTLTVIPSINNNVIGFGKTMSEADTTVCFGNPVGMVRGKNPAGGDGVTYNYQWLKSWNGTDWQVIPPAINQYYLCDTLHHEVFYKRMVHSDVCTGLSNYVRISVLDTISKGEVVAGVMCYGDTLLQTAQPQGGDGTYRYRWEKSNDGMLWTDSIGNARDLSISFTAPCFLRRFIFSGPSNCCQYVSSSVPIQLHPLSVLAEVSVLRDTICRGDTQRVKLVFKGHSPWYFVHEEGYSGLQENDSVVVSYPAQQSVFVLKEVRDSFHCRVDTSTGMSRRFFALKERPSPEITSDTSVCGLSVPLKVEHSLNKGIFSVEGNIAATFLSNTLHASQYGTLRLIYTESNGTCEGGDTATITFYQMPEASILTPDTVMFFHNECRLLAVDPSPLRGQWQVTKGEGSLEQDTVPETSVHSLSQGVNKVLWKVFHGACTAIDSVTIEVKDLFIPGGFSPNGDGVNDVFEVPGIENALSAELVVYNGWGNVVYESSDYRSGQRWDGTSNGNQLPEGIYYYVLKVNGKKYKGVVVIKR